MNNSPISTVKEKDVLTAIIIQLEKGYSDREI